MLFAGKCIGPYYWQLRQITLYGPRHNHIISHYVQIFQLHIWNIRLVYDFNLKFASKMKLAPEHVIACRWREIDRPRVIAAIWQTTWDQENKLASRSTTWNCFNQPSSNSLQYGQKILTSKLGSMVIFLSKSDSEGEGHSTSCTGRLQWCTLLLALNTRFITYLQIPLNIDWLVIHVAIRSSMIQFSLNFCLKLFVFGCKIPILLWNILISSFMCSLNLMSKNASISPMNPSQHTFSHVNFLHLEQLGTVLQAWHMPSEEWVKGPRTTMPVQDLRLSGDSLMQK